LKSFKFDTAIRLFSAGAYSLYNGFLSAQLIYISGKWHGIVSKNLFCWKFAL